MTTRNLAHKDLRNLGEYPNTFRNDLFMPLEQAFDSFFTDFFRGTSLLDKVKAQAGHPKMDVFHNTKNQEIVVQAAVPGAKQSDISVEMIDDSTVEISGSYDSHDNDDLFLLKELSKRPFSRRLQFTLQLGEPTTANLKDGILTLIWKLPQEKPPEKRLVQITQE